MPKKTLAFTTLTFFLNFLFSCTNTSTFTSNEVIKTSLTSEMQAKKLQEVQLKTESGEIYTGKLLALAGKNLILLPFPYWNVESIKIDLDEIYSIKVMKKDGKASKGFVGGFGWGFLVMGILSGLGSEYDVDYEDDLKASAIIGAFIGILGFVIGGLGDLGTKSKYDLYKMSSSEKIIVLKKIMGL